MEEESESNLKNSSNEEAMDCETENRSEENKNNFRTVEDIISYWEQELKKVRKLQKFREINVISRFMTQDYAPETFKM